MTGSDLADRYQRAQADLGRRGQGHLLRWWDELNDEQRSVLLAEIESLPWGQIDALIPTHVLQRPQVEIPHDLEPAEVYPAHPPADRAAEYAAARQRGRDLLSAGRVAAFTVAGGQGTRLGFDGPKGAMVVTPVGGRSLFALFAEMVLAARRRYGSAVPWYIMTSPANHAQTVDYFERHRWFGLPTEDVRLFSQGVMPALSREGKLLLEAKHRLSLAPDGHGGSLKALSVSGALADMRRRGIETISYFQVDNPLVKPFDPLFLGLHAATGSDMSTKVLPKSDDLERVGNLCRHRGKVMVIEYSDFPEDLAHARNPDGSRRFNAGNAAIHAFDVAFVERVTAQTLPFRRADKAVAYVDDHGQLAKPAAPNAVKLETFVFDVLPLANNPLVLEIERAEEFSPVKNATGVDSLETAQRDLIARSARWLEQAGIPIPRRPDGAPDAVVVLGPLFALEAEELVGRKGEIPAIHRAEAVFIG